MYVANLAVSVVSFISSSMRSKYTESPNLKWLSERTSSVYQNVKLKDRGSFFSFFFLEKPMRAWSLLMRIKEIVYQRRYNAGTSSNVYAMTAFTQGRLSSIKGPGQNCALRPLPTQPLTGIKIYMSIQLNIYLLYWFFQENQYLIIKNEPFIQDWDLFP